MMSTDNPRRDLAHGLEQLITRLKNLEAENAELRSQLYTDELTGIANRRLFEEKLDELVELAHSSKEPLALLIADVDGLKRTNDALGHSKGDELLQTVAHALESAARSSDLVGRFGGDEFYVLLPGFSPLDGQSLEDLRQHTIDRYQQTLAANINNLELPSELHVSVSFGVATLNSGEAAAEFHQRVDQIAQAAKKSRYENLRSSGTTFSDERL